MKESLQYIDDVSNKFWAIEVIGNSYTVTFGKIGTTGTKQIKEFADEAACLKAAKKVYEEKIKKGYSLTEGVHLNVIKPQPNNKQQADLTIAKNKFEEILEKQQFDLIFDFLDNHLHGIKVEFKKYLAKQRKHYLEYVDLSLEPGYVKPKKAEKNEWGVIGSTYGTRAKGEQSNILIYTSIALFDKSEVLRSTEIQPIFGWNLNKERLCKFLLWGKFNWLEDFLLISYRSDNFITVQYDFLRWMEMNKLISVNLECIAYSLRNISDINYWEKPELVYKSIKSLCADEVFFKRDILAIFDYPINVQDVVFSTANNGVYDKDKIEKVYLKIIVQLVTENKLNRDFVIEKCLQVQTKDWNLNLRGFYRELLSLLSIENEELIKYQSIIFTFVQHSAPAIVVYGVDCVKLIYSHANFKLTEFVDWLDGLFIRTDCKGGIDKCITILGNIVKNENKINSKIFFVLADIFLNEDYKLQSKAAKLFAKYCKKPSNELREKLQLYNESFQGDVRIILKDFLVASKENKPINNESHSYKPIRYSKLSKPVIEIREWDDLFFKFGSVIHERNFADIEILANSFITHKHLFPNNWVELMGPYRVKYTNLYVESLAINYFIGFLSHRIENSKQAIKFENNEWQKVQTVKLFQPLLVYLNEKTINNSNNPLLCLPTHYPHYVAPEILMERILKMELDGEEINYLDLTIALARMPRESIDQAIPILDRITGSYKPVLEFALGLKKEINLQRNSKKTGLFSKIISLGNNSINKKDVELWINVARLFNQNRENAEFSNTIFSNISGVVKPLTFSYTFKESWNEWKNYKNEIEKSKSWLEMHVFTNNLKASEIPLIFQLDHRNTVNKKKEPYFDYEFSNLNKHDVIFWHGCMPFFNQSIVLQLLKYNCKITSYSNAGIEGFLYLVRSWEITFDEKSSLLLSCCFFMDSKELRHSLGETLQILISHNHFPVESVAKFTAKLLSRKYGGFRRLMDVLLQIKNISDKHNFVIFLFLDLIIQQLEHQFSIELPMNFGKLIEVMVDIKYKTNQSLSKVSAEKLEQINKKSVSYKIVKQLIEV